MISPPFRAILADSDTSRERPLQIYGSDINIVRDWAYSVLAASQEGAAVTIYQTIEQAVELVTKLQVDQMRKAGTAK